MPDPLKSTLDGLSKLGELVIPVPQHPAAAEPCCLFCGDRDGRTKAGALYCHDCLEAGVQGAVRHP